MPTIGRHRYLEAIPRASRSSHSSTRAVRAERVEEEGVLLLLHAFPLNARMWEPQLALADHGWRIIAPHFRQFDGGDSDPPASSVDDYAADAIDLLDALRIEEAVIGGLSMGGYVAFAIFRHAPRYVRGLVLADTRTQADTPEGIEARKKMLELLGHKGVSAVADEMIPKLLGETTRRTRPEVVQRVRELVLASSSDAVAGAIRALMSRPDSTPLVASIHCPTLIIVGEEDTLTPRPLSEQMQRGIAGAELEVVPSAGHLTSFEQSAAFNDSVARFLRHRV